MLNYRQIQKDNMKKFRNFYYNRAAIQPVAILIFKNCTSNQPISRNDGEGVQLLTLFLPPLSLILIYHTLIELYYLNSSSLGS